MIVPIIPYPNTLPSLLLAMPKWTMQNMIRNCNWNSGPRKSVCNTLEKSRTIAVGVHAIPGLYAPQEMDKIDIVL